MQKEDILNYLLEIKNILREKGIEKIGLFGSFAKDKANALSDIDIAIQLQQNYLEKNDVWNYFTLLETIQTMLFKKFSRKVDIFDLDSKNDIEKQISKEIIYV